MPARVHIPPNRRRPRRCPEAEAEQTAGGRFERRSTSAQESSKGSRCVDLGKGVRGITQSLTGTTPCASQLVYKRIDARQITVRSEYTLVESGEAEEHAVVGP